MKQEQITDKRERINRKKHERKKFQQEQTEMSRNKIRSNRNKQVRTGMNQFIPVPVKEGAKKKSCTLGTKPTPFHPQSKRATDLQLENGTKGYICQKFKRTRLDWRWLYSACVVIGRGGICRSFLVWRAADQYEVWRDASRSRGGYWLGFTPHCMSY